jgi:recombinational DNA repair protein RecR
MRSDKIKKLIKNLKLRNIEAFYCESFDEAKEPGKCVDCRSKERVCSSLVIIEGQAVPDRMKVFIVNESAGF